MESRSYLDTHVVLWLSGGSVDRLSAGAEEVLHTVDDLRVSPKVEIELLLLYELDRIHAPPGRVLARLGAQIGLRVCDAPFGAVVEEAGFLLWTRDPFDR